MCRFIPDGAKITALREKKGIKQLTLAHNARISDRTLRKIKRNNSPVQEHVLINIASCLEVSANEITFKLNVVEFKKDDRQTDLSPIQMRLRMIMTGGNLFALAQKATLLDYVLLVDHNKDTVKLMSNLLTIVQAAVDPYNDYSDEGSRDGFESENFPIIHRIAKLGKLISQLRHVDVSILANSYERMKRVERTVRGQTTSRLVREVRFHLCICNYSQDDHTI